MCSETVINHSVVFLVPRHLQTGQMTSRSVFRGPLYQDRPRGGTSCSEFGHLQIEGQANQALGLWKAPRRLFRLSSAAGYAWPLPLHQGKLASSLFRHIHRRRDHEYLVRELRRI
jgi:hypothetical protein